MPIIVVVCLDRMISIHHPFSNSLESRRAGDFLTPGRIHCFFLAVGSLFGADMLGNGRSGGSVGDVYILVLSSLGLGLEFLPAGSTAVDRRLLCLSEFLHYCLCLW